MSGAPIDVLDAPRLPLGPGAAPLDAEPSAAPAPGRLRRFWFVPAGVALLGAAALVPSVGGSGPGAGEARLSVDGVALVTDDDGSTTTVRDDRIDVGPGDRVEITEGRGVFEMAGDVRLEGLGGSDDGAGTTVEMAVAPRLVEGPLLVDAPSPLEIEATAATVTVEPRGQAGGAARLERGIGLTVGTYRGTVTVDSAGRQADVPRYRRAEIAAPGALGPDDLPLRYEPDDPWDRRYLADGLVIDAQVEPLLASLSDAGRRSFLDPSTLRRAMPGLPSGGGLADRLEEIDDGGDALVLAAVAVAVEDRSFTTAWDGARSFQGAGAGWGLVALDQGVRSAQVLPAIRSALDTLDLTADLSEGSEVEGAGTDRPESDGADPGAGGADGTEGADPTGPGGGAGGTDGGDPGDGGTDPGGGGGLPIDPTVPPLPPTTVPNIPLPTLPEPPDVGGAVGGVVDGVTDGVDGVVPGAGGAVGGVVGGVGGVVGGVGGAVEGAGGAVGGVVGGVVGGLGGAVGGLGVGLGGGSGGG